MSDLNDLNKPVTTDTEPNVLDTLRAHIVRAATWAGWSSTANKVAGIMSAVTAAVSGGRSMRLYRRNDANSGDEEVVSLPGVSVGGNAGTASAAQGGSTLRSEIDARAPLDSPALTGAPTTPTAAAGTNSGQIASTAFVATAVANVVNTSPAALDTLNELAAALGNDANFSSTVNSALGNRVVKTSAARPGVTKLYRNDDDTPYNVQTNWTGSHWFLRGYDTDTFHGEVRVGYADSAGSAGSASTAGYADSAGTAAAVTNGVYTWGAQTISGVKTLSDNLILRSFSPTLHLRDTDGAGAFWHCNSSCLYLLRSSTDAGTWSQVNGQWPMMVDLTNNNILFGGGVRSVGGLGTAGTGGLVNEANSFRADVSSGNVRFYSNGPDVTTRGGFEFRITGSLGGLDTVPLALPPSGQLQTKVAGGPTATLMEAYACRAWVNFWGAVPSIRGSANVSSVTRLAQGQYRVNFLTAMPDANYAAVAGGSTAVDPRLGSVKTVEGFLVSSVNVNCRNTLDTGTNDIDFVTLQIFR
jgi:hypothetical protein